MQEGEPAENDQSIGEIDAGGDRKEPDRIKNREGPDVETPPPVPPLQQVDSLDHLPVHLVPRHPFFPSGLEIDRKIQYLEQNRGKRFGRTHSDRRPPSEICGINDSEGQD